MFIANNFEVDRKILVRKQEGTVFRCPWCSLDGIIKSDDFGYYPIAQCSHVIKIENCDFVFDNLTGQEKCAHHLVLTFGNPIYG